MPYKVRKDGNKYRVVREAENGRPARTVATHDTRESAESQQHALYAAEGRKASGK